MFKEMFYAKISRKNLTEVLQSTPTPAYIYFKSLILERIQELKSCAGKWFQLHYAVKAIRTSLQNLFEHRTEIAGTRLLLEPGRFWVGESGIYVTRVLYRKPSATRDFLIVDGGLHQNYLIAGGMGQVIKRNFEMDVLRHSPKLVAEFKFDVAGKLCTPQDILATNCTATEDIQPGDLVIFFNCGAYGYSARPLFFLSHPEPGEHWV